jgi:cytochrome c-type biogenesis protein CcmH
MDGHWRRVTIAALLSLLAFAAGAAIETYEFESDELRQRYQQLAAELRCPKCQNQNIADSNAPIAQDLRKQLYQQLHAGRDDQEIIEFMVDRYGEFVLYRPRWSAATAVLWTAPVILLVLALLVLLATLRRNRAAPAGPDLSADEQRRLAALVGDRSERD